MKNPRDILPEAGKGKQEHEKAGPSLYNPNAVFLSFGSRRSPSPTIPMASLLLTLPKSSFLKPTKIRKIK